MVWYITAALASVQVYPDGSLFFSSANEISLSDMNANIKAARDIYVCGQYLDPMSLWTTKVCEAPASKDPAHASCAQAVTASCNYTDADECASCARMSYDFVRWSCASAVVDIPECSERDTVEEGAKEVISHEDLADKLQLDNEVSVCGHNVAARNIWAHGICDSFIPSCTQQISSACPFGAAYGNSFGCMNCAMLNYEAITATEGKVLMNFPICYTFMSLWVFLPGCSSEQYEVMCVEDTVVTEKAVEEINNSNRIAGNGPSPSGLAMILVGALFGAAIVLLLALRKRAAQNNLSRSASQTPAAGAVAAAAEADGAECRLEEGADNMLSSAVHAKKRSGSEEKGSGALSTSNTTPGMQMM
jgi:hypothetical protein